MAFEGIEGKVAIVTGGGGGIGEAYATGFAAAGAKVVVAELDKEGGERVASAIRTSGGEARFVHTDIGSEESTQQAAAAAIEAFGGIDFLVNNAAVFKDMKLSSLLQVEWDYYKFFMNVNVDGALLMARACYGSMAERGGGSIVNQSSTAAWMGVGYYGLSKLAINGLTQSLARELGPSNIRVNAIAPGPTDTEALNKTTTVEFQQQMVSSFPLARLGQPEDMVGTALYLCSDASKWVTGQIIAVDGGQIIRP
jgi:NAD(P)-dependent dehydrogenase (short-subunit alcohol dehydrogenase family)